jgi:hypothetical protein
MKKSTAELIVEASENIGGCEYPDMCLDVYEDYSGRGMFGSKTHGVTGKYHSFAAAVAEASANLVEDHGKDSTKWTDFLEDLENLRTDSMGLDSIFY